MMVETSTAQSTRGILPLGDSITEAESPYNSYRRALWFLLQDAGLDVDFVGSRQGVLDGTPPDSDFDLDHEGHWGWTTQDMLNNDGGLGARLAERQVDIALLLLGANDLLGCRSVEFTLQGLSDIIDALRDHNSQVTVLLATLLPMDRVRCEQDLNISINALNAALPTLVAEKSSTASPVVLVDLHDGFDIATDGYDGIHPNESGEQKVAQAWFSALLLLLQGPGLFSDSFEPGAEQ